MVDSGDALLGPPALTGEPSAADRDKAVTIMRAQGLMGLDAMSPGEAELLLGTKQLLDEARHAAVPLLCANLVDAQGRRPFEERRLVTAGGVRVGLFGLYEPPPEREAAQRVARVGRLRTLDAVTAARTEVRALQDAGAEVIVMLAHLGMTRATEVAKAVPGIHLGLVSHTGWRTSEPQLAGSTLLFEPGRRGQVLGHLEIRLGQSWRAAEMLVDDSRRFVLYNDARSESDRLRRELAAAPNEAARERIVSRAERVRSVAKDLQSLSPPTAQHTLIATLIELDPSVPEHAGVLSLVRSARAAPPPGH